MDVVFGRALSHCILMAGLLALSPVVFGQVGPDISRGQEIANRMCVGCHGTDGRQGSIVQGVVVQNFSEIARRPGRTQEMLEAFVTTPDHPMPALPMSPGEIRDVVAYIRSLN